jgi:hypothetical protein
MAKRFSDTKKWDKQWFRSLDPALKCVWFFLCERCDHAGIWEIDCGAIEFYVGYIMPLPDILELFGDRVRQISQTKLWLPGFIEFQYGTLNPKNRVHNSVLKILKKYNLPTISPIDDPSMTLASPIDGLKDKDKDKVKDKEKDKDREKVKDKEKDKDREKEKEALSPKARAWINAIDTVKTKHKGIV